MQTLVTLDKPHKDNASYSTVVLDIYFVTVWEHWLGIAKPKNVYTSILNPSIK